MEVKNKTIIITDPCYIINHDNYHDWPKCKCGRDMEALGITNYIVSDNGVGDLSFEIVDSDGNRLGKYCADSGQFGVFELDEVRKYNPNIDAWIEKHDWCVTVIPNFIGKINWIVADANGAKIIVPTSDGNINFTGRLSW